MKDVLYHKQLRRVRYGSELLTVFRLFQGTFVVSDWELSLGPNKKPVWFCTAQFDPGHAPKSWAVADFSVVCVYCNAYHFPLVLL